MSDLFLNKIYQGDCIQEMNHLYAQHGSFVDLAFADPPYNLEKSYKGYSDDRKDRDYLDWCEAWLQGYICLLKPNGTLFVLNLPRWATHHAVFLNQHLYFQNWIVWDALSDPRGNIMPAHYALLHYTKHPTEYALNPQSYVEPARRCLRIKCVRDRAGRGDLQREALTNIWHDIHRIKHKKDRDAHPCQLPEKLLARIISLASNPGDVVFDAFMGTGTTAVVAKQLGRQFVGVENDETYLQIASERLANFYKPRPSVKKAHTSTKRPKKADFEQLSLTL